MVTVLPYALTTRQKVKDFAGITDSDSDPLIDQLINVWTDFIEAYCGGRRFLKSDYVEIYDSRASNKIFLNQRPVIALTKVEYRTGIPSNPTWATYSADGYLSYLNEGYIRFFTKFQPYPQAFRVTYSAGYLIDFGNEFDTTKHTLPFDLSGVATQIVAKNLTNRLALGKSAEATEGQSVTYESKKTALDPDTISVLNKYGMNHVAP